MPKQKILQKVKNVLEDIYEEYKSKGLTSIYLWGSITRDEFIPEKSDIDTIAIVEGDLDEEEINQKIKSHKDYTPGLKLRLLYKTELDTGNTKSYLCKILGAKTLVYEFPTWKLACGKKYQKSDFSIKPEIKEVLKDQINLSKSELEDFERGNIHPKYVVNNLLWTIFYHERLQGNDFPFSYKNMKNKTSDKNQSIVNLLLKIRKNNWDKQMLQSNLKAFKHKMDSMENAK